MEIYLDQSNYIGGGLSPRSGARVVVHPSSQAPLPNENGLTIQPHTATSAALEQVEIICYVFIDEFEVGSQFADQELPDFI